MGEVMSKVMALCRGLPSSGKSYRAKELAVSDGLICSADDYWGKTREEYIANWKREKLHLAHFGCQDKVRMAAEASHPLIIVDNTNIKVSDMTIYYKIGVKHGYTVRIEEPTSPWWLNDIAPYLGDKIKHRKKLEEACRMLCEKNKETHGVPYETIVSMMERYQPNVTVEKLAEAVK